MQKSAECIIFLFFLTLKKSFAKILKKVMNEIKDAKQLSNKTIFRSMKIGIKDVNIKFVVFVFDD